jgi:putative DNA primase/helicase
VEAIQTTTETERVYTLPVVPADIDAALKEFNHWVVHRNKEPYSPRTGRRASTTDSRTWASFDEVVEAYTEDGWDGIGFVFSSGDPFVGLDFDRCRNRETGEIDAQILKYIRSFENAYAEVSVSGTGVHLITYGKLRGGAKRGRYEIYGQERFFALTGVAVQ